MDRRVNRKGHKRKEGREGGWLDVAKKMEKRI